MTDYSLLLNKEQLEAATSGSGPLLVLAAAGTGKTRTLVYRVAYLVEQGENPESLLLLTFTNRAAREMLDRARLVAGSAVGQLWSGTFHHVCNRFLRRFAGRVGYVNDFTILDGDDSRTLIEQCIRDTVLNRKDFPKKDVVAGWIGKAANRGISVAEVVEETQDSLGVDVSEVVRVAECYAKRKEAAAAMDFDDLLINGLRLLQEHEDIRQYYSEKFRHVLVDEYQDTNMLQARIVDILASKHRNIMAVGDDFQCIYSWRGANFRNIMDFPERWQDCRIIRLEQNYRSVPEILDAANACIKGNPEQFQKTLRPTREPGSKPVVHLLRDGDEQARFMVDEIRKRRAEGVRLRDMAVLYRAHFHSIELQIMLARASIPYVITSGTSVFEQAHTKDVIAFLRVCTGSSDEISFTRVLKLLSGVGERTATSIWEKLAQGFNPASQDHYAIINKGLRRGSQAGWKVLADIITKAGESGAIKDGGELVEEFVSEFYTHYLTRTYENYDKRLEDIHELALQIGKHPGGMAGFLQEVALFTNIDHQFDRMSDNDEDLLYLSTVHQAKGLEWKQVFILWAVEGMFPSNRSITEGESDAEERRLFYVAITRAKDRLSLCVPAWRHLRDGSRFVCQPSRFVKELPRSLLRERYGG